MIGTQSNDHASVVIPFRNREALLGRAVNSVITQRSLPECVCVDDASEDGGALIVESLAREHPEQIVLGRTASARGAQSARNIGIRAARGDVIAFLDSDDEYLPHSIDLRLAAMRGDSVDVVHSECLVVRHPDPTPRLFGTPALSGNVYARLLAEPGPTYPALMMTREAIEAIGLLDESIMAYQEWDLAIRLAEHHRFAFVREPTFIYHCHAGETISKNTLRGAKGYAQIVEKHADAIQRHLGRRGLALHAMRLAGMFAVAGDADTSEAQRARAFRLAPLHVSQRWLRDRVGAVYDRAKSQWTAHGANTVGKRGTS
jgi:glycosyltransferase involved in cell wall biosynthesis